MFVRTDPALPCGHLSPQAGREKVHALHVGAVSGGVPPKSLSCSTIRFARPTRGAAYKPSQQRRRGGQRRRRGWGRSQSQVAPRGFDDFIHGIDGLQNVRVFLLPSIP